MTQRRSRGDGGLHWDEKRQRWIATASLGFDGRGKRITRKASGKTKTEAKAKLKEILRAHDDGFGQEALNYTVKMAMTDWLAYGLRGRAKSTVANYTTLSDIHIVPQLGARKLRELAADEVDRWLSREAKRCSTRTLRLLHSLLNRAVKQAQKRDKVRRNVVGLCEVPVGLEGRPSKALNLDQVRAVLLAAEGSSIYAYLVLSLLIGARTEELRALSWEGVDLEGKPAAEPPVPPSISVLRSVREGGDTKTKKSRRRLAMPNRCADALRIHRERQEVQREKAGDDWQEMGLVFASRIGTELDSHNVRRAFRKVIEKAGMVPGEWTPRELRHSFVSVLSAAGVPIEEIARLVGHKGGSAVTEAVYRKEILPVMLAGAQTMDRIFPTEAEDEDSAA